MLRSILPRSATFVLLAIAGLLPCHRAAAQLPTPTYGFNIGNTLEPPSGEGTWGPAATKKLIDALADAGFNTVRIPCAWDSNANQSTRAINPTYMARVKEVVDWCYTRNLYVIINCHWDNGWLENKITNSVDATIDAKMNSYWTQIATTFRDYDHHLLFAGANEPNCDTAAEWATLRSYYNTFISAVRATGGNNESRWLVVQGPNTNIDLSDELVTSLPVDSTPNRLVWEVHYYAPFQFVLMTKDESWGKMAYFWGKDHHHPTRLDRNATWGEEAYVEEQLQKMKTKFIDRGVPVIIGEFQAMRRQKSSDLTGADYDLHLASRVYHHEYLVSAAHRYGLKPIYWDIAGMTFDWTTGAVTDPANLRALLTRAGVQLAYTGEKQVFFRAGEISFTPTFRGTVSEYSATGLPAGLTIDANTGRISGTVSAPTSATVTLTAKYGEETASQTVEFNVTPPAFTDSRLVNISLRATTTPGEKTATAGLVITGNKTLLARLAGPALSPLGVPGTLAQPTLKLYSGQTLLATWGAHKDGSDPAGVAQAASYTGAFPFSATSNDSAVVVTLPAGQYTLQATGANDASGAGLIELYDVDRGTGRFANLSMRAQVGTDSGIMINGLVVEGPTTRTFLVRAIGPTLKPLGVSGALMDPKLTVYEQNTQVVLASNDNWSEGQDGAAIATVSAKVGAFTLANDTKDAAVLVTVPAGQYAIRVEGTNGTTGVALAEIYEVTD